MKKYKALLTDNDGNIKNDDNYTESDIADNIETTGVDTTEH